MSEMFDPKRWKPAPLLPRKDPRDGALVFSDKQIFSAFAENCQRLRHGFSTQYWQVKPLRVQVVPFGEQGWVFSQDRGGKLAPR